MPPAMQGEACSVSPDCDGDLVCIEGECDIMPPLGMLDEACDLAHPCGEGLMC